jgi:hypothetical protein
MGYRTLSDGLTRGGFPEGLPGQGKGRAIISWIWDRLVPG